MGILILAAHPDDEVLGCGASIAKWTNNGMTVNIVILSEGATSRHKTRDRKKWTYHLNSLRKAALGSAKILKASSIKLLNFPDNRMDTISRLDIVKEIEAVIDEYKPSTIITHHSGDVNIDHRVILDSVIVAARPQPNSNIKRILTFETPSSTEWQVNGSLKSFIPNWFEDVSNTMDAKLRALQEYEIEMREWPHPRSLKAVKNLAKWRGSSIGVNYAEAFMLLREIN